jgi:hypothetical protein
MDDPKFAQFSVTTTAYKIVDDQEIPLVWNPLSFYPIPEHGNLIPFNSSHFPY